MRYTGGIKREGESIGRWCRRYVGISRRDERRSHFGLHQCLRQSAKSSCSTPRSFSAASHNSEPIRMLSRIADFCARDLCSCSKRVGVRTGAAY